MQRFPWKVLLVELSPVEFLVAFPALLIEFDGSHAILGFLKDGSHVRFRVQRTIRATNPCEPAAARQR